MAKIDVVKYYNSCITQYKDLTATLEDLQAAFEAGQVTEEQVKNFVPMVEAMKNNIECLSYVVFLLNQPRFSFKQAKYFAKNHQLLEYFKQLKVDKDTISLRNEDVIKQIKHGLEEIKK